MKSGASPPKPQPSRLNSNPRTTEAKYGVAFSIGAPALSLDDTDEPAAQEPAAVAPTLEIEQSDRGDAELAQPAPGDLAVQLRLQTPSDAETGGDESSGPSSKPPSSAIPVTAGVLGTSSSAATPAVDSPAPSGSSATQPLTGTPALAAILTGEQNGDPAATAQPGIAQKPAAAFLDAPASNEAKTNPAPVSNQISIRLNGPDASAATVRVQERFGEVRVSVHSPDAQLSSAIRGNVDELRSQLQMKGWNSETSHGQGRSGGFYQRQQNGDPQRYRNRSQNGVDWWELEKAQE